MQVRFAASEASRALLMAIKQRGELDVVLPQLLPAMLFNRCPCHHLGFVPTFPGTLTVVLVHRYNAKAMGPVSQVWQWQVCAGSGIEPVLLAASAQWALISCQARGKSYHVLVGAGISRSELEQMIGLVRYLESGVG